MTPMLEAQNISGLQKEQPLLLLEENLEQLSIGNEEEYGWEDELEELSRRLQEPVNLNAATKQQLEQFPFLTDIQIENLLAYVYIYGQMQTIYELQLVEEMDKRTIDLLLPFVCVRAVKAGRGYPALKSILKYGKHETLARLDVPFLYWKNHFSYLVSVADDGNFSCHCAAENRHNLHLPLRSAEGHVLRSLEWQ